MSATALREYCVGFESDAIAPACFTWNIYRRYSLGIKAISRDASDTYADFWLPLYTAKRLIAPQLAQWVAAGYCAVFG